MQEGCRPTPAPARRARAPSPSLHPEPAVAATEIANWVLAPAQLGQPTLRGTFEPNRGLRRLHRPWVPVRRHLPRRPSGPAAPRGPAATLPGPAPGDRGVPRWRRARRRPRDATGG